MVGTYVLNKVAEDRVRTSMISLSSFSLQSGGVLTNVFAASLFLMGGVLHSSGRFLLWWDGRDANIGKTVITAFSTFLKKKKISEFFCFFLAELRTTLGNNLTGKDGCNCT